eukprot:3832737-Amphidinium_carterae.1
MNASHVTQHDFSQRQHDVCSIWFGTMSDTEGLPSPTLALWLSHRKWSSDRVCSARSSNNHTTARHSTPTDLNHLQSSVPFLQLLMAVVEVP